MGFATKLRTSANALITKFGDGMTVTFSRASGFYSGATEDADTSYTVSTMAPIEWTAPAVVVQYEEREIDGSTVKRGDRRLLISAEALEYTPTTDDRVTISGQEHAIVSVLPVQPGETAIYIELQVRR